MSRIFHTSFIAIFLLFFSACASEYSEHFTSEKWEVSTSSWWFSSGAELLVFPGRESKNSLLELFKNAEKRIWVEIYTWTEKDTLNVLIDAKKRGVDVRVILEWNVYGTPRINFSTFEKLRSKDIPVVYADNYRYSFTHAKFFLIDERYFISTWNFTQSLVKSNRDIIFSDTNDEILLFLESLFLSDFHHKNIGNLAIPQNIVLSPHQSREKIDTLLLGAKRNIKIYAQTLSDPDVLAILKSQKKKGISVEICTAKNETNTTERPKTDISWTFVKSPYLHAKVIFIDDQTFFIGSQNLTENAIEKNREVGILLEGAGTVFQEMKKFYHKDCIF